METVTSLYSFLLSQENAGTPKMIKRNAPKPSASLFDFSKNIEGKP